MKKPLIYIVDDDEVYLKVIKHKLEEHGLNNLKTYQTGEACLEEIEQFPDYLILDFSLEGLNGLDVLSEVKKQSKSTKVIILTVIDDKDLAQKCIDAGAESYIVKNDEGLIKLEKLAKAISDANKGFLSGLFSSKNNFFLFLLLLPLVTINS